MIKEIKICSENEFIDLVKGLHLENCDTNKSIEAFGNHYLFISIKDEKELGHFLPSGKYCLNQDFGDYVTQIPGCFLYDQAREIREFIMPHICTESPYKLVIHCHAGMSRSYTVGALIRSLCFFLTKKIPPLKTKRNNSSFINNLVKDKLVAVFFGTKEIYYRYAL